MKRILGLTTAALMGASMLAGPALAQADVDTGADIEIESEFGAETEEFGAESDEFETDLDTGTTAAIDGEATFDDALGAISGGAASATAIEGMSETDEIRVVRLGDLEGHDPAMIDDALAATGGGEMELQSAIEANAALSQELEAQGVAASDVVAAQVEADGSVTVYVR